MNGAVMPVLAMFIVAAEEQVIYAWPKLLVVLTNILVVMMRIYKVKVLKVVVTKLWAKYPYWNHTKVFAPW